MPSKVPAEEPEIDMDESEFDMDDSAMMGAPVPERKEYLWATNLEGICFQLSPIYTTFF